MSPILLVHGGWLDESCWAFLLPFLKDRGIDAHTITLPGSGPNATSAFKASIDRSAAAICEKVQEIGAPVILLGHSMGGYSITAAAQMCPDLVEHMIYLTAWVPPQNGLSMAQFDRKYNDIITGPLVQPAIKWKLLRGVLDADPQLAIKFLCPLASDDQKKFLMDHMNPQPIRPGLSKVAWTDDRMGAIPKTYIECTKDVAIPLAGQRHFQKNASFEAVVAIESDHAPFLCVPEILADTLANVMGARM